MGEIQAKPQDLTYEKITPSSGWVMDSQVHLLLVDLPGFRLDDVKLEVDSYGKLTVSGGRILGENKYLHFKQTFKLPENSEAQKISRKFEGDTLFVSFPLKETIRNGKELRNSLREEKHDEPEGGNESPDINGSEKEIDSRKQELIDDEKQMGSDEDEVEDHGDSQMEGKNRAKEGEGKSERGRNCMLMEKLNEFRGIIITAVLAVTLGVLLSHRLQPTRR
ncbi:hypothetical protein Nepgr_003180 [Nepenthes gracilis]|uniref:SHSP domain-containing protein n=1 Tax=Nepenthes gracilis TaxID=150966 RepID=A0AAD3RZ05_NEPGR|nr:hypothetical protein Nepgr_003180 [Nepenthes gracilis]